MNDQQLVAFAHGLGVVIKHLNDEVKRLKLAVDTSGLTIEAPNVTVEPQINVEGPDIDFSAIVDAVTGLTTDNVSSSIETVSHAITALAEREGIDLTGLIEVQGEIAGAVKGSTDKLLEMNERALEAQAKTGDEISRLADLVEKSTGAGQMQFNAMFEMLANVQKQLVEQSAVLSAPKRLTFGADGKPVGVETVLRQ